MKRLLLTLTVVAVSALTMYGQSRINFNNFGAGIAAVTIGPVNQGAASGAGAAGDFAGSAYSVQLRWAAGSFATQALFDAANPTASAVFPLFGTSGNLPTHGPLVDGTGLWDGGTIAMGGPAGTFTLQARVWFNGGQFATYALASAGGRNVGQSGLTPISSTEAPTPAPDSAFQAFTVGTIVPEPSTFALAGLGAASLLLFRRRK